MEKKQNAMLLELVKSYPVLYDPNHPKYDDENKLALWEDIAVELNISAGYAKRKWHSFVHNYKKYLKYTSDKAVKNEPIRIWMWASSMSFVQRHLDFDDTTTTTSSIDGVPRKRQRLSMSRLKDDSIFVLSDESDEDIEESDTNLEPSLLDTSSKETNTYLHTNYYTGTNTSTASSKDETSKNSHKFYNTATFSATEHVMLGFAKSIDGLSDKRKVETKKKIAEVVRMAEMEDLEERSADDPNCDAAASTAVADEILKYEEIVIDDIVISGLKGNVDY